MEKNNDAKALIATLSNSIQALGRGFDVTADTRHSKRAMKRMKRKRIEDTADIPSYMSNHSIFSYYENKRAEIDCQSVDNDCGHRGYEIS
ncbi:uncharacterized protein A4U43_C04F31880 [Asparagus officinalis]|uniref:Uncharacterized protein n=1 Tax=Asparagus officinalis TaxID=4686 RepID=A0A5P1F9N7_ASPOF|nr:uncharacterized protein A4U43_C04F31880 [Asparagus officinalis]